MKEVHTFENACQGLLPGVQSISLIRGQQIVNLDVWVAYLVCYLYIVVAEHLQRYLTHE